MSEAPRPWPQADLEAVPQCPVCGSAERSLLYKGLTDRVFCVADGAWDLYRCAACASAWLDPRPTPSSIGRAYESYYTHLAEDDAAMLPKSALVRQLHAWQNDYKNARYGLRRKPSSVGGRWLVRLVPSLRAKADAQCRHMPPPPAGGGRLLDVGFGSGAFLKIASEMGWHAEGIDFDPKAVEVARARGLNVSCASADELAVQEHQYDVITISHVIEHVHAPMALLRNLYRLLKPGGLLWLDTPNLSSYGARRFGSNWRGLEPPRHLVLFTPQSMINALEKIGFQRISQHWHGMTLFSIYAESTAIARGKCAQEATHQVVPSLAAVIDELREMMQPTRREFLTLSARK
jgi:2-polyprenyl-3-methyl-5-hydroxy-6-metoxy-1,4-benzoquinol methylase